MRQQPEQLGALFPGALPPQRGQVSRQAYKRGYIPKTYTPAERAAAHRVIAHWNRHFSGVDGAYRANPGDACNVKAYVRMLRNCQRSDGLFQFGEQETCNSITAYRRDPNNNRLGRWKRFADWCTPENIDFYEGKHKVAKHRVEQPRAVKRKTNTLTAAARRVVKHKGLVDLVMTAAKGKWSLRAALESDGSDTSRSLLALLHRRASLSTDDAAAIAERAKEAFTAYYHRPAGGDQHDEARLEGIELSLLDLDAKGRTAKAAKRKGAVA